MAEKRKRDVCIRPDRMQVKVRTGGSRTVEPDPEQDVKKKASKKTGGKK